MAKIHDYTFSLSLPKEKVETLHRAAQEQLLCTQCQHALEGRILITGECSNIVLRCSHCGALEIDQS